MDVLVDQPLLGFYVCLAHDVLSLTIVLTKLQFDVRAEFTFLSVLEKGCLAMFRVYAQYSAAFDFILDPTINAGVFCNHLLAVYKLVLLFLTLLF